MSCCRNASKGDKRKCGVDGMKKCCIVLSYFGRMPNYFDLFLKSCGKNHGFDFLIFTDDKEKYAYPENVKVIYMTLGEMKEKLQAEFDFGIFLKSAYKLCDYRVCFGYVFEDVLKDYEYWGYCDNDLIFGDIGKFFIEGYDKMFCLGHLTIFKNTAENNRLFMYGDLYKKVFSSGENMIFDECWKDSENIHDIFLKNNKKVFEKDLSVNLKILSNKFVKITFQPETREFLEDKTECLYTWENGKVYGYCMKDSLVKEEYLYIHLQERKMKYKHDLGDVYKIVPNSFLPLEMSVDERTFERIKKRAFNLHLLEYHLKWKIRGLKKRLKGE